MRKKGIISVVICFILGTLGAAVQSLGKVVEDYIRKNKVGTVSPGDTAIRKTGNLGLKYMKDVEYLQGLWSLATCK